MGGHRGETRERQGTQGTQVQALQGIQGRASAQGALIGTTTRALSDTTATSEARPGTLIKVSSLFLSLSISLSPRPRRVAGLWEWISSLR
jgi:hypothetical protein